MNHKLLAVIGLILTVCLPTRQASAHISYQDIQTNSASANADGSTTYSLYGLVSSNGAWADATDASWGNTHNTPWYKFEISNQGGAYVNLSVARSEIPAETLDEILDTFFGPDPNRVASEVPILNDLTPAFSLYKGLLPKGSHDGSTQLPDKDGVWQALADTRSGNGRGDVYDYHEVPVYNDDGDLIGYESTGEPTLLFHDDGEIATIQYLAHAGEVDGTAARVSLESIFLSPGSYSVALGGACYACFFHAEQFDLNNLDDAEFEALQAIENDASHFRGFSLELNVRPVPVPSALWMMVSGLLGLIGIRGRVPWRSYRVS